MTSGEAVTTELLIAGTINQCDAHVQKKPSWDGIQRTLRGDSVLFATGSGPGRRKNVNRFR